MTENDFDAFSAVVVGFAELRGRTLSPEAIALFFRAMVDWSLADFTAAAEQLLRTCEWMPTPFHFEQLRKAGRPVAAEAWLIARKACGSCHQITSGAGAHFGPGGTCGDAFIDAVVATIGGYRAIAMCNVDAMGFLEKRFTDAYESMRDAQDVREAVPQLAHEAPRTRLIGPRSMREGLQRLVPPSGDA